MFGVLRSTSPGILIQLGEVCLEACVPHLEFFHVHPYLFGLLLPQEHLLSVLVVLGLLVVENLVHLQPLNHALFLLVSEMGVSLGLLLDLLTVEKVILREIPLRQ